MDERDSSTPNEDCWHSTYGNFASVTRPFSRWARGYLHCEHTSILLSIYWILLHIAHEEKGGRGRLLHCTRAKLLFGRLVSLTAIWRVENYCKCSNAECNSNCIQNDSNHTQSSPPGCQFCKCGDWITCSMNTSTFHYTHYHSPPPCATERVGKLLALHIQLLHYH